jgi:hypothetical protein
MKKTEIIRVDNRKAGINSGSISYKSNQKSSTLLA